MFLPYLLLCVLYLICASTFIISKFVVDCLHPFFYIGVRSFLSLLIFSIPLCLNLLHAKGRNIYNKTHKVLAKNKLYFFGFIFMSFILAPLLDLVSLQYLTGTQSALIFALSPLATSLMCISSGRLTLYSYLGIILAICGFIFNILPMKSYSFSLFSHLIPPLLPGALCFLSVLCFAWGWIMLDSLMAILKKEIQESYSESIVIFYAYLFTFFIWIFSLFFIPSFLCFPIIDTLKSLLSAPLLIGGIFVSVLLSNVIFTWLYTYLLEKFSPTTVSVAGVFCPLYVAFLSFILFKEPFFNVQFLTGFLISGLGVSLYAFSLKRAISS